MPKINKRIIIANWKMHPAEMKKAEKLFTDISKFVSNIKKSRIVICPPFLYLEKLRKNSKKITLGAQNLYPGEVGAFTGEISAGMLSQIGVKYVILGHSERRNPLTGLGENNDIINRKIKSALSFNIVPILCIGEKNRDEKHAYFDFVKSQIVECLKGVNKKSISKIIFAYEPIWSISTTANHHNATAEDAGEMAIFIRKIISDLYSPEIAGNITVIYGGSVNSRNISEFLAQDEIKGFLIGHASLDSKKFNKIIEKCEA